MLEEYILLLMLMSGVHTSVPCDAQSSQCIAQRTAQSPDRSPQTEAMIRNKLLNDPLSLRVGAAYPELTVVSFTNYDCLGCKEVDGNLEKLLKAYPRIAVTYKLISWGPEASTAVTRRALSVWIEHPEKFHAFHHALMSYRGMADDMRIYSAYQTASMELSMSRPDTQHIIDVNKEFLKVMHLPGVPATLIGEKVLLGPVSYDALEEAVRTALAGAERDKHLAVLKQQNVRTE